MQRFGLGNWTKTITDTFFTSFPASWAYPSPTRSLPCLLSDFSKTQIGSFPPTQSSGSSLCLQRKDKLPNSLWAFLDLGPWTLLLSSVSLNPIFHVLSGGITTHMPSFFLLAKLFISSKESFLLSRSIHWLSIAVAPPIYFTAWTFLFTTLTSLGCNFHSLICLLRDQF